MSAGAPTTNLDLRISPGAFRATTCTVTTRARIRMTIAPRPGSFGASELSNRTCTTGLLPFLPHQHPTTFCAVLCLPTQREDVHAQDRGNCFSFSYLQCLRSCPGSYFGQCLLRIFLLQRQCQWATHQPQWMEWLRRRQV